MNGTRQCCFAETDTRTGCLHIMPLRPLACCCYTKVNWQSAFDETLAGSCRAHHWVPHYTLYTTLPRGDALRLNFAKSPNHPRPRTPLPSPLNRSSREAKGRRVRECHPLVGDGVPEGELLGMQAQAGAQGPHFRRRVEVVPQDRVPDGGQVHTKLVGAAWVDGEGVEGGGEGLSSWESELELFRGASLDPVPSVDSPQCERFYVPVHVTQLTGNRYEVDEGAVFLAAPHLPLGQARLALLQIHHLIAPTKPSRKPRLGYDYSPQPTTPSGP
jgi:hypothetical protein